MKMELEQTMEMAWVLVGKMELGLELVKVLSLQRQELEQVPS